MGRRWVVIILQVNVCNMSIGKKIQFEKGDQLVFGELFSWQTITVVSKTSVVLLESPSKFQVCTDILI